MSAPLDLPGYVTAVGFVAVNAGLVFGLRRSRVKVNEVRIGTERRRPVGLGLDELQQGILIGGSPGAGKTTLLAAMEQRLPEQIGALFVGPEGRSVAP